MGDSERKKRITEAVASNEKGKNIHKSSRNKERNLWMVNIFSVLALEHVTDSSSKELKISSFFFMKNNFPTKRIKYITCIYFC